MSQNTASKNYNFNISAGGAVKNGAQKNQNPSTKIDPPKQEESTVVQNPEISSPDVESTIIADEVLENNENIPDNTKEGDIIEEKTAENGVDGEIVETVTAYGIENTENDESALDINNETIPENEEKNSDVINNAEVLEDQTIDETTNIMHIDIVEHIRNWDYAGLIAKVHSLIDFDEQARNKKICKLSNTVAQAVRDGSEFLNECDKTIDELLIESKPEQRTTNYTISWFESVVLKPYQETIENTIETHELLKNTIKSLFSRYQNLTNVLEELGHVVPYSDRIFLSDTEVTSAGAPAALGMFFTPRASSTETVTVGIDNEDIPPSVEKDNEISPEKPVTISVPNILSHFDSEMAREIEESERVTDKAFSSAEIRSVAYAEAKQKMENNYNPNNASNANGQQDTAEVISGGEIK